LGNNNGGTFVVNSSRTITCSDATNGIVAGSSKCLDITSTNSTININSSIRPSTTTSTINTVEVGLTYTGNTLNIVGDVSSSATSRIGLSISAPNTTLSLSGNPSGGATSLLINSTATNTNVTLTNTIFTVGAGTSLNFQGTGTITINGTIIPTSTGDLVSRSGSATIVVNGDVYGAASNTGNAISISTTGGGTITINGNVFGGNVAAISTVIGIIMTVNGNVTAGVTPGITSTITSQLPIKVFGNLINSNTATAIQAANIQLIGTTQYWQAKDDSGNDKFLYSPGTALGNPATSDVRLGTTYAGGALVGTLNVPPVSSVAVGVPVDNTIGTGIFTITDMGALLSSYVV
jgi:hypothetical protein